MSILEVSGLRKVYTTRFGGSRVEALRNVQFTVEQGEYVAIMGESGSGKTTLLNILAALDEPTAGTVRLDGQTVAVVDLVAGQDYASALLKGSLNVLALLPVLLAVLAALTLLTVRLGRRRAPARRG